MPCWRNLVTHGCGCFGLRADEGEAAFLDALGEIGVLAQKAIAGVDGFGIGHFSGRDDGRHVEVAQRGRCRADAHGLVGQLDVLGVAVGLGIHHHGLDAEFPAGALDAQGDLAPVGNQNFLKHEGPRGWAPAPVGRPLPASCRLGHRSPADYSIDEQRLPYSTAWPCARPGAVMVPPLVAASISLRIFIASMIADWYSPFLELVAHFHEGAWRPGRMRGLEGTDHGRLSTHGLRLRASRQELPRAPGNRCRDGRCHGRGPALTGRRHSAAPRRPSLTIGPCPLLR
ncbi:hypothetical protein FQR65_LT20181 [Abscondita terminalis]|nr:hypothetical protein FQR65_LT20181 [Abscondita terminalis]